MASRIAGITVEIGGDTTKLSKALSGVNKSISQTQTALKDVNKLLKLDPGNTELLRQKQQNLKTAISETEDKLKALQEAAKSSDLGAAEHDALQREIIETEQKLKSLKKEYGDFGSVAKQKLKAVGDQVKEVGDKVKEAGEKISSFGAEVAKKVTAPIVAVGTAAVAAFKDVDAGYDTIIGKTGATGTALDDLKDQFDDIFSSMSVTSEQVGEAIGEVNTRFGLTGDVCEEVSRAFLQYAQLNSTDVSSSIDTVQNALAAFNMEVKDAPTLLDVLNRTGQNTGASVDSMSASLVSNATALQEMGMNIYESVGFLGQLETAGADSESVISGMKRALKSATEKGIPFNEALTQLQSTILNGTGSMDGLTMAYDLFGKSGAGVYQAVKNGQIDFANLTSSTDILNDSVGSVAETFAAAQDPADEFAAAMNGLKVVGAELGGEILGALAPAIETLRSGIERVKTWWDSLSESQQQMVVKIGLVVAAIGPVIMVIGKVISGVGSVISIAGTLMSTLGALISPIGLVVAAIAGAVAIGVALYKNWDELSAWAAEKWSAIKDVISNTWEETKEVISSIAEAIVSAISGAWESIKSWTSETWNAVKEVISNTWEGTKEVVSRIAEAIGNAISNTWDNVKTKVKTTWDNIKSTVTDAINKVKTTITTVLTNIKSTFSNTWNTIKSTVSSVISSIKSAISSGLESAKNKVTSIFSSITDTIRNKIESAKNTVRDAIEKIKGFFNFSWELPRIKLPHFGITGKFSLNPPSIPHFSVDWYKKGGILSGAQIFGRMGDSLLGGGESGKEAVLPLASFYDELRDIFRESLGGNMADANGGIRLQTTTNVYIGNKEFKSYVAETAIDGISRHVKSLGKVKG